MESGIRLEHFDLLQRYGGTPWTGSTEHLAAREQMREPYRATKAWADALRDRLFPGVPTDGRMAVVNQGQHFSRYTWWRIYPSMSAPRELAYTVGIDDQEGFIVKLDTYQPTPSMRAFYEAERGPTNIGSPFAGTMTAAEGVQLSFEALIDWSVAEIAKFKPSYEALAARLGLGTKSLRLLTEADAIRGHLDRWRSAVLEGAISRRSVMLVPDGPIVVRATSQEGGLIETELGHDPSGRRWLVRINEAREPGSPNTLTGIAVDANGRTYLLRQGLLKGGGFREEVTAAQFRARTGMKPVDVEASPTGIERDWFLVASLDEPGELVRTMTAEFVRACSVARSTTAVASPGHSSGYRLGADEKGGTYVVGAAGPRDEKVVVRKQGLVWLALQQSLLSRDIMIEKPGHSLGYEVDAAFARPGRAPLLIEIKTGARAADIHTGVGQLHLYPALIDGLDEHERVLLLPYLPDDDLVRSVEKLGIIIATYDPGSDPDGSEIKFSADFLQLCGLF
jgi:hypothetical protein